MSIQAGELTVADMTYNYRSAGPIDGEAVVLLHGCPETSLMWEPIMSQLAAAGYFCFAPDQRGYSPGARPTDIAAYRHKEIGEDVFKLASAAGLQRFHLVGHDWGACAGWSAIACDNEQRIASFTSLSIPHYKAFATAVRDDPEGEFYRAFLQTVLTSDAIEAGWSTNDCAALRPIWLGNSDVYARLFSQPGAMASILNWYRACDGHMGALDGSSLQFGPVDIPTLLVWGNQDPAVLRLAVELAKPYMRGAYEFVELNAGHWLVQEQTKTVNELLLRHLKKYPYCR
jgi:pimeloyl-ACP methyl ester carboxylesterase